MNYIFKIEIYKNYFICCFYNIRDNYYKTFELSDTINQIKELKSFVKSISLGISYNGLLYDYPILHEIIISDFCGIEYVNILHQANKKRNSWENKVKNPIFSQLDIFYLKDEKEPNLFLLQSELEIENIIDLSYDNLSDDKIKLAKIDIHTKVDCIFYYFNHIKEKIIERQELKKEIGFNAVNSKKNQIAKSNFISIYSKISGLDRNQVIALKSYYPEIKIKDFIRPLQFKTPLFNEFQNRVLNLELKHESEFNIKENINNIPISIDKNGLNGFLNNVFSSNNELIIIKEKFNFKNESLYPESFYHYNKVLNSIKEKEILYMYFNEWIKKEEIAKESFLYDLKYLLSKNLSISFLILNLIENLYISNVKFKILKINNNEYIILIKKEDINNYRNVRLSFLVDFEHESKTSYYEKIFIKDCDSYIGLTKDKKIELNGIFKKENDFPIVLNSIIENLLFNKSIDEYIKSDKSINNFIGNKTFSETENYELKSNGNKIKIHNFIRFIVSKSGNKVFRLYKSKRKVSLYKEAKILNCNSIKNVDLKLIDYDFYIKKSLELKSSLLGLEKQEQQTKLF